MFKNFWTTKNVIFLILTVILLLFIPKITGILLLFFASYVIAAALNPYVNKLQGKMSRGLATTTVLMAGLVAMVALFLPIFVIAYKEIRVFVALLPEKLMALSNFLLTQKFNGQNISDMIDLNSILGSSSNIAQNIFNQSVNITMGFTQVLVVAFAITMIVFYLLVDKSYLRTKFLEFFPPNMKDMASCILSSITLKVGSYVRAQILSMVTVGIMVMFSLVLLGVEYSLLLGLIAGILDIIPILGPTIALALIILVTAQLGWVKVVLAIVAFLIVQQISNYMIRPFLFGKFMALHPLMVFFSLFVAQQFLGVWGVILAPAIAATVCVLIDELYLIPINKGKDIEENSN